MVAVVSRRPLFAVRRAFRVAMQMVQRHGDCGSCRDRLRSASGNRTTRSKLAVPFLDLPRRAAADRRPHDGLDVGDAQAIAGDAARRGSMLTSGKPSTSSALTSAVPGMWAHRLADLIDRFFEGGEVVTIELDRYVAGTPPSSSLNRIWIGCE